jgi:hypothetical protein
MAKTAGLVQRLTVMPSGAMACAWIGPTPANTELLFVLRDVDESAADGSFENSMVDVLIAAVVSRREIVALHDDDKARITDLEINPA